MKKVSQSKQKLLNYLDAFMDSDFFQDSIEKARKELNVPSDGYKLSEDLRIDLIKNAFVRMFFYIPNGITEEKKNFVKRTNSLIAKIIEKFQLDNLKIKSIFKIYLFYNERLYEALDEYIINDRDEANLCQITDMKEYLNEYITMAPPEATIKAVEYKFKDYPIIIRIHPSATQRDITDYIKNYWPILEYHLSKHKNKITTRLGKMKTRNKKIKERDEFIYKNKHLSRKELSFLVSKKFPDVADSIDEGSVGKIVSLEKKRRKKV